MPITPACAIARWRPQAGDDASMKRPAGSAEEAPAKRAKEAAAKPAAPTTGLGGLAAYSDSDSVSPYTRWPLIALAADRRAFVKVVAVRDYR